MVTTEAAFQRYLTGRIKEIGLNEKWGAGEKEKVRNDPHLGGAWITRLLADLKNEEQRCFEGGNCNLGFMHEQCEVPLGHPKTDICMETGLELTGAQVTAITSHSSMIIVPLKTITRITLYKAVLIF